MKLVINSSEGIVGIIQDYDGPVPRRGDYIGHPTLDGRHSTNVMSVKTVTHYILTRTPGAGHFTGHSSPEIEVWV